MSILVPELDCSLFSVASVIKRIKIIHVADNDRTYFFCDATHINHDGIEIELGKRIGNCWTLDVDENANYKNAKHHNHKYTVQCRPVRIKSVGNILDYWHKRLSHQCESRIRKFCQKHCIPIKKNLKMYTCPSCIKAKMKRTKIAKVRTSDISKQPGELTHCDHQYFNVPSYAGNKYILLHIDDYSKYITGYLMKSKTEVSNLRIQHDKMFQNMKGYHLKTIRADNEMNTIKLTEYCRNNRIKQQFTTPNSPFQNGTAERYGGTVCNLTRTCLIDSGMNAQFCGKAIQHVIWSWNRTPNNLAKGMCPYRAYHRHEPE